MPIVSRDTVEPKREADPTFGTYTQWPLADAGGLTQFGAHLELLAPGGVTSLRHWHSEEDEFLYMLNGELVLYEGPEVHTLRPGQAAAFPAGVAEGHFLRNESTADASYLIIGTRRPEDVVTYPAHDRVLHRSTDGDRFTTLAGAPADRSAYADVAEGLRTVDGDPG